MTESKLEQNGISLDQSLFTKGQNLSLQPRTDDQAVATADECKSQSVAPVPPPAIALRASTPHFRNGKIARLPKLERDMVNRMLHNHVPYKKIVGALDEASIVVTERNISNWKTRGGYKDWCAEQEKQINLARLQDNLVDYLRKNDAVQIPEVGMQIAATQLSSMLLQPDMVQQLAASPEKYSKVVDMLCRLSTQIQTLQKERDEAVRKSQYRGTAEHMKREDERWVETLRTTYSCPKLGDGPRDPDIPHRNELPRREELHYPPVRPPMPSFTEVIQNLRNEGILRPAAPALPSLSQAPKTTAKTEGKTRST